VREGEGRWSEPADAAGPGRRDGPREKEKKEELGRGIGWAEERKRKESGPQGRKEKEEKKGWAERKERKEERELRVGFGTLNF
jgi:hypothetical protein